MTQNNITDLENEYVVGAYGTTYRAMDVFRTGEMQGTHNERLRIIKLLEALIDTRPTESHHGWRGYSLERVINLVKGETEQ